MEYFAIYKLDDATNIAYSAGVSSQVITSSSSVKTVANHTLYASWTANKATINVKKDGSAFSPSNMKIALYSGSTEKYSATNSSGSSVSWSPVVAGTYKIYAGKNSKATTTMVDTGVTITVSTTQSATIDYYTVTITAGSYGTVNLTSLVVLKNETYSASSNVLTVSNQTSTASPTAATGHTTTFSKWTLTNASGTQVGSTATKVTAATTIYANFTRTINQYKITYDAATHGGSLTKGEATATLDYNATVDLTGRVAAKSGWTFVGWNTNKDATSGLSSYNMPAENKTLYAIYKVTYTAKF